jgi:hypothetical protein
MINFRAQFDWVKRYPESWQNIISGGSVRFSHHRLNWKTEESRSLVTNVTKPCNPLKVQPNRGLELGIISSATLVFKPSD